MRIAVVSDIHGNLLALEAVVRDIARRGVDAVVNLGDCLSGPLLPLETAQFLMAQGWVHLLGAREFVRLVVAVSAVISSPEKRTGYYGLTFHAEPLSAGTRNVAVANVPSFDQVKPRLNVT